MIEVSRGGHTVQFFGITAKLTRSEEKQLTDMGFQLIDRYMRMTEGDGLQMKNLFVIKAGGRVHIRVQV